MDIQHTYIVNKLTRKKQENNLQDIVTEINFTLKSIDLDTPTGEYNTMTDRIIKLSPVGMETEDFIAYENITEEIAVSWIREKSGDLESSHEKIMNNLASPPEPEYVEEVPFWANIDSIEVGSVESVGIAST